MKQAVNRLSHWVKDNWLFALIGCVGFIIYSLISISKHLHFNSTGFDLVIFDQAIRHYSDFLAPASSFRGFDNLLGDHFHPILILLAPLYWLFDTPVSLLVAQALLIISTSLPVYLYTKNKLGVLPALFLTIAFVFNAALLRAINFDFHEIAFAIPLIAWAIYLIDRKLWIWLYIVIGLLLLVKEDMSILVAFLGIYLLLLRHHKQGLIILASGLIWFFLATKLFIPYFAGEHGSFNYWTYDQLGPDIPSSLIAIIKNPLFAISLLFFPTIKLVTLIKTFGVFLGLPLLSPLLLLAFPLVLERFLSSNENYWQFHFHYGATLTPILVMATADSLHRLGKLKVLERLKKIDISLLSKLTTMIIAIIAILLFAISPMNFIFTSSNYRLSSHSQSGYEIISTLPKNTSICTTNHIAPHLGSLDLTLIGFDNSIPEWKCTNILTSHKLDQSSELDAVIMNAKENGYKLNTVSGDWVLYRKE